MQTRNNGVYQHGTYKTTKIVASYDDSKKTGRQRLSSVTRELNIAIVRKLRASVNSSKNVTGKIPISKGIQQILTTRYNIGGRYKQCSVFLKDFSIITQRYFNKINWCQIKESSFELKVLKGLDIKYFPDRQLKPNALSSKPRLFFRFQREDCIDQTPL